MRIVAVLATILAVSAPGAHKLSAQPAPTSSPVDSARLRLASELLRLMHSVDTSRAAIPSLQQFREMVPMVPAAVWDSLEAKLRRALAGVQDSLVPFYAERFTTEELRGFIEFFETPLGRRFLAEQPVLAARMLEVTQRVVGGVTDEFLMNVMIRRVPP